MADSADLSEDKRGALRGSGYGRYEHLYCGTIYTIH